MRLTDNVRASLSTTVGLITGLGWVGGMAKAVTPVRTGLVVKTSIGTLTSLITGGVTLAAMLLHPELAKPVAGLSVAASTALASAYVAVGTGLAYAIGGGLGDKKPAPAKSPFHRAF